MTIICGYLDKRSGKVWLASDSRTSGDNFIFPEKSIKIVRHGAWLLGLSGPSRFAEWQNGSEEFETIEGVRDSMIEHVRSVAKDSGGEVGDAQHWNVALLAAKQGHLWVVGSDGSIWQPEWGFAAIGSGYPYAYGAAHALFACSDDHVDPETLVRAAVEAAICFCADCGGPVQVFSI